MKDDDFYFEETSPRNVKIALIIIAIVIIGGVIGFIYVRSNFSFNLKNNLKVELGSKISKDVEFYVSNRVVDEDDYTLIFNEVSLDADGKFDMIGEYNYRVKYKSITKTGVLHVVDTTAPDVTVMEHKVGVGEEVLPDDFIAECSDYSMPCTVELDGKVDTSKEGTFDVKLLIKDQFDNTTKKTAKLTVQKRYKQEEAKKNDLSITHYSEEFSDFNNKFIIKYKKALTLEELEADDEYHDLIEKATSELNELYVYIPAEYRLNKVVDFNIIEAYNRYEYTVAVAIRVKLDNGMILYLTK